MTDFLRTLGIELPVVQAGMGGGIATHELAAAVSDAGGLGTIGLVAPGAFRDEIALARELTEKPVAANVIVPLARWGHWKAAGEADVLVTHWGRRPRRRTRGLWIHQCGSVQEARAAHAGGADAVIAQGVEAGGHVRAELPALELLERIRRELPDGYPVLLAGGVADRSDVEAALEAGAVAAVAGTRFLMTDESRAHNEYKARLREARATVLTELFGIGWPAPHRVIPNKATERWLAEHPRGPRMLRAFNRVTAPVLSRTPGALQGRFAAAQRPGRPFFSPAPPAEGAPSSLVEAGPLYAGETVARIDDVRPARRAVADLTP